MLKRLVIPGLPCQEEAWADLLGSHPDQKILPMRELFERTESSSPKDLANYIKSILLEHKPESILCHDLGVPLTLLALLKIQKEGLLFPTRLTVFNGVFRNVSLWRARHPLRMQYLPVGMVLRKVKKIGGRIDDELVPWIPQIRALYRQLILFRMSEKVSSFLGLDDLASRPLKNKLKIPIQMILSPNDPFLPTECLYQLKSDLEAERVFEVPYGHFPYTAEPEKILPLIAEFEATA